MQKHTAAILNLDTAEAELRETMPTGSPPVAHRLAKFFYVKGSHRPRPLTRLRRSLIDKTTPITLIRTRRMRIDEFVCIMAVGDRWRSLLLSSVKPQGRNKMCIGLKALPHVTISSTISLTMLALTLCLQR